MYAVASWYGPEIQGRPTASGETFDMHAGQGAEAPKVSRAMDILRNIDGKAQNPFDIEMHRAKGGGFGRAED